MKHLSDILRYPLISDSSIVHSEFIEIYKSNNHYLLENMARLKYASLTVLHIFYDLQTLSRCEPAHAHVVLLPGAGRNVVNTARVTEPLVLGYYVG